MCVLVGAEYKYLPPYSSMFMRTTLTVDLVEEEAFNANDMQMSNTIIKRDLRNDTQNPAMPCNTLPYTEPDSLRPLAALNA